MKPHVKNYIKHFNIGEQDTWVCEVCGRGFAINNGLEIHHIKFKSRGGSDDIDNCICLCRKHHDLAHNHKIPASELQYIHNSFMTGNRNVFIK